MKEEELLEALETQANQIGVLPVLSLLLDWVARGMYLEIFAELIEMAAELTEDAQELTEDAQELTEKAAVRAGVGGRNT